MPGPTGLAWLSRRVPPHEIPGDDELVPIDALGAYLDQREAGGYTMIAVGDIMLAGRAESTIARRGADHCFAGVGALLTRAAHVLGNLEGPFAPREWRLPRNHSYAVPADRAQALRRAGIDLLHVANNHVTDCGRRGVLSTLATLRDLGLTAVGGGADEAAAHRPVIRKVGGLRIGVLGYYWNQRCAALGDRPGAAMDTPAALEADLRAARAEVDRLVVGFHWGVPYERSPLPEDRAKARFAIDCGADLVVGHHAHVLQPIELHRGRPIVYGLGNFAFGSGNSQAEGALLAIRFGPVRTTLDVFPLYVKNRDPRVAYQPRVMRGGAAQQALAGLAAASAPHGATLEVHDGWARMFAAPGPAEVT